MNHSFLEQLNMDGYAELGDWKVERLSETVLHMDEGTRKLPGGSRRDPADPSSMNNPSSIYFVEEGKELLVIDGGNIPPEGSEKEADAKEILETLAKERQIVIALTHGHGDHIGLLMNRNVLKNVNVRNIYLGAEDLQDLPESFIFGKKAVEPWADCTIALQNGDTFRVGEHVYEAYSIAAHTPGSMVFVQKEKKIVFTGDAIGSGFVWLFWKYGENPLKVMEQGMIHLQEKIAEYGDLRLFGGHRWQQFYLPNMNRPGELSVVYVQDMRMVLAGCRDGSTKTVPYADRPGGIEVRREGCHAMIDTSPQLYDEYRTILAF